MVAGGRGYGGAFGQGSGTAWAHREREERIGNWTLCNGIRNQSRKQADLHIFEISSCQTVALHPCWRPCLPGEGCSAAGFVVLRAELVVCGDGAAVKEAMANPKPFTARNMQAARGSCRSPCRGKRKMVVSAPKTGVRIFLTTTSPVPMTHGRCKHES